MSRILARVVDGLAGPGSVRPRLPTLFEPGLDIATGPEDGANKADDLGSEPASAASSPAARLNVPPIPADPAPELPPVARTLPGIRQPAVKHGPPAGPSLSSLIEPVRQPVLAGPHRLAEAGPAHPVRPQPAHPVRPQPALPTPASLAEPPAPRPRPLDSVADTKRRITPLDQAPLLTGRREPVPSYQPDTSLAPAPRRSAARQASGVASDEPTIHIAIGRVEIRADRAAAPQPEHPASRRRPAAPDLSEYLQRRGRPR